MSLTVVVCCKLPVVPVMVSVYVPAGVPLVPLRAVVLTVIVEFAWPLPGLTELGENEHVDDPGRPEQLIETGDP